MRAIMHNATAVTASQNGHKNAEETETSIPTPMVISCGRLIVDVPMIGMFRLTKLLISSAVTTKPAI